MSDTHFTSFQLSELESLAYSMTNSPLIPESSVLSSAPSQNEIVQDILYTLDLLGALINQKRFITIFLENAHMRSIFFGSAVPFSPLHHRALHDVLYPGHRHNLIDEDIKAELNTLDAFDRLTEYVSKNSDKKSKRMETQQDLSNNNINQVSYEDDITFVPSIIFSATPAEATAKSTLPLKSSTLSIKPVQKEKNMYPWEPIDIIDVSLKVRLANGETLSYHSWLGIFKSKSMMSTISKACMYRYREFQKSNGDWMDLESYYIDFIQRNGGGNIEGKSLENLEAFYKMLRSTMRH